MSIPVQPYLLGDFIEFFANDAELVSDVLQITLTRRTKDEKRIPMAGIPAHSWERYRIFLLKKGIVPAEPKTGLPEELK